MLLQLLLKVCLLSLPSKPMAVTVSFRHHPFSTRVMRLLSERHLAKTMDLAARSGLQEGPKYGSAAVPQVTPISHLRRVPGLQDQIHNITNVRHWL